MIRNVNLNDKTYEDRISEAISSIPIYTDEWTNYNPSDPGITILENLALFETLQQDDINDIPSEVKANLLKMAGFVPSRGKCAHVLVKAIGLTENITLPRGHEFMVYDIPFETGKPTKILAGNITDIFLKNKDQTEDFSRLLDSTIHLDTYVFTKKPTPGMELYIMTDMLPDPGSELIMYAGIKDDSMRNPFTDADKDLFSSITWEYYTNKGFEKVHVKDNTHGFLKNGEIRIRMGSAWPKKYSVDGRENYCIRLTLNSASYDVPPAITDIHAFLFELTQMSTKSYNISGTRSSSIELSASIEANNYISVFAKEEKSGSYRKYEPFALEGKASGRYYTISESVEGVVTYKFSKNKFSFGPEKGRACVRVLVYNEDVMKHYQIGKILGYDNQEFLLPFQCIVADSFSIVARRLDENGEYLYDFVKPGRKEEGNLYYSLNDRDGIITIKDAGDYIGADLFMAGCSVYLGDAGNIRAGNRFTTSKELNNVTFINPAKGYGGVYPEDLEEVRLRFIKDIDAPYTAITEEDYEHIAMQTSGLCISKTRAHLDENEARVYIAVLPGSDEEYPQLSDDYIKKITERVNERRLLTTKVCVCKSIPVPVNVRATVYVKQHFENCEQIIEKELKLLLDYPNSDRKIGESVKFDEVFRCIENLPCVEFVHSLSIRPGRSSLSSEEDMDIIPVWNALAVPGHISIDTITYNG